MVVEELGHGCEQEAAQQDAQAAEDEGPGADVEAEAARPHRHHPGGQASATRPLQWKLLNVIYLKARSSLLLETIRWTKCCEGHSGGSLRLIEMDSPLVMRTKFQIMISEVGPVPCGAVDW